MLWFEQWIEALTTVRCCARPGVVFGPRNEPRAHRVQLYVSNRVQEMCCVERAGVISPLPEVSSDGAHPVDALRVLAMHGAQRARHAIRTRWLHDQMHVVRHQAIRKNRDSKAPRVRVEQAQVSLGIALRQEHPLTVISALRDVMRDARKDGSAVSRHDREAMGNHAPPLAILMRNYVKNEGARPLHEYEGARPLRNRERGHVRATGHPLASLHYVAFPGGATGMCLGST